MRNDNNAKVIMITSSVSVEGKTFLSANLSAAFAVMGKKTITLGFDLSKPGLHKAFGITNEEGLSNFLSGQVTLQQIIRPTEVYDNLHVITCGQIAPNPQELLSDDSLTLLFELLKKDFDYIIIDTSPIGIMSDAMILARYADITLYVVRQDYTPKDQIKYINELFRTKRLNNIGIVVNGIKDEKWNGYSYGYGSYKYYSKYYDDGD
jgi:capsular exopolysaccharide synthesis family protein